MKDIKSSLVGYLNQVISESGSSATVTLDTPLLEDDLLDSINLARVIMFVEEQFGVSVADADVGPELFKTPASLAAYVSGHLRVAL